jgi:hypothetical protein
MTVTALEYPPAARPYDAPRWITSERPVRLAELVQNLSDLQVRGASLNDTVNIATHGAGPVHLECQGRPAEPELPTHPGSDLDPAH